ncbi:MAG: MFS transporter [Chloroflexota bacterium]|nr:MFS transporter [Chloroflexota bacterium]
MAIKPLKLKIDIFIFTLTRTAINTSYRMVYPFLPFFARGLGVEPASLALAFSVRSFLGIFGPFLATVADTHDRKTGMLLGIGLFTAGSGMVALWPSFWTFIIATSLTLLGNGVFIPSMNAFLGDHTPYNRRGRVLAITELSWAVAFIGGIPIVRFLVENYNWTTPFILFSFIGVGAFVLYLFLVPAARVAHSEGNTIWRNLSRILKTWPALAGLLSGILFTTGNEMVNLIFGVWIENQFGLDFAALTIASVVIGVSELGGEVVTGVWLDAVGKRRMIWIFLGLNSLAAILLPFTDGRLNLALIGLGFFYITFETVLVSAMTLMTEVLPTARATMLSATIAGFSLGRMLGDLLAPGLFEISFWLCCLATVVLNLLAAGLLTQVRVQRGEAQA